jgi:hypothetical protein
MNIINLRKNLRRLSKTRRIADRRVVPYEFGTPEWEENIKKNYLSWPKTDRRKQDRRVGERRVPERRQSSQLETLERSRLERKYARILLTPEERKLIEDMYLRDLD